MASQTGCLCGNAEIRTIRCIVLKVENHIPQYENSQEQPVAARMTILERGVETESKPKSDALLIVWLLSATLWDVLVFWVCCHQVFRNGHSGWWFLLAILLTYQESLFKALRKRFL